MFGAAKLGKRKGRGRKVFTTKISGMGFHYFDVLNFRMQKYNFGYQYQNWGLKNNGYPKKTSHVRGQD